MKQYKLDNKLKQSLNSGETTTVLTALQKLQERGNKLYLPILFDLLISNPEKSIVKEIEKLLENIKDKETVETFIEALKNDKYNPIKKTLLTACWQSGLDFSAHVPFFVQMVIADDLELAFEAFTVVENLRIKPENETIAVVEE
ncbi:MAG: hypothetical protein J7L95_01270, partial [Prolixibacteraceae bacterium]|nr:hypothetical protein [Prolixibacteraceae bacterium]